MSKKTTSTKTTSTVVTPVETFTKDQLSAMLAEAILAAEEGASVIKEGGDPTAQAIMDNATKGNAAESALKALGMTMAKGKATVKAAAAVAWTKLKAAYEWAKAAAPEVFSWLQEKIMYVWAKAKALVVGTVVFSWKAAPVVVKHVSAMGTELAELFHKEVVERVARA